ncbi:MAG: nucleotidyltransferase domain-containing protein [Solirubrobacterales bacterium]|nr:nucleotidyltransferase domain-containing protein [Solirubrobacterales bacterium]
MPTVVTPTHFHAVIERRLAESAETAEQLRAQARELLVNSVADAHQAGMTQREISASLGRSQPEVSRLLKLSPPRFKPKTELGRKLVRHRHLVLAEVQNAGASNVRVFGSVARGEDGPASDIDLLIDIESPFTLVDLARLQREIHKVLDHDVDVIPSRGLRGKIRSSALEEAVGL